MVQVCSELWFGSIFTAVLNQLIAWISDGHLQVADSRKGLACEQALWGALAAGREKKGKLATMRLWNLNIYIEKVDVIYWLAEMTLEMVHTYPVKTVTENAYFLNGLQRGDFRGHRDSFWLRQNDVMRLMIRFKNIRIHLDEAPSFRFKIGLLSRRITKGIILPLHPPPKKKQQRYAISENDIPDPCPFIRWRCVARSACVRSWELNYVEFILNRVLFLYLFSKGVILNWICNADKTTMYVSEEGRLRCSTLTLYQHNDRIVNWKFDCGDRTGPHRNTHFLEPDFEGYSHAMSIAVANSSLGGAQWIAKLMQEIIKQFEGKNNLK